MEPLHYPPLCKTKIVLLALCSFSMCTSDTYPFEKSNNGTTRKSTFSLTISNVSKQSIYIFYVKKLSIGFNIQFHICNLLIC